MKLIVEKKAVVIGMTVLVVLSILTVVLIALGAPQFLPSFEKTEIYKFECPGQFKISLRKGKTYTIWNYRQFRSRLNLEKYADLKIQIHPVVGEKFVSVYPCPRAPEGEDNDIKNFGIVAKRQLEFVAPSNGDFIFDCQSKCIVAIAPYDEEYVASTIDDHWINFHGSVNEFDFIAPVGKATPQTSGEVSTPH